jgi:hypothetical protein
MVTDRQRCRSLPGIRVVDSGRRMGMALAVGVSVLGWLALWSALKAVL